MRLLLFFVCFSLTSCMLPARWAEDIEERVRCDMSVQDVESLSGKSLIVEESPIHGTHYIREGETDVWFTFKDKKLKTVQIFWAHEMMKYAQYPKVDLCGEKQ